MKKYLPVIITLGAILIILLVLTYWETRTDTPWGEEVRQAVEAFVRDVLAGRRG